MQWGRASMRGMGRVFKRGSVYWIAYTHSGKEYRESSQSEKESDARRLLKKRIGEGSSGKFVGPNEERLTFHDLAQTLVDPGMPNYLRKPRSVTPVDSLFLQS
jgi:hypothetical protein